MIEMTTDLKTLMEEKAALELKIEQMKQQAKDDFAQKVKETLETLKEEAEQLGFDAAEFGLAVKTRKPRKKAEPKYRFPSGKLWTGAGKTPIELQEYEAAGGDRKDLLIVKE